MTLIEAIREFFKKKTEVSIQDLYAHLPDRLPHSIRAQVYKNLGKHFTRIGKGLYVAVQGDAACVVLQGDATAALREVPSSSIDALVTDPPYPWLQELLDIHTTTRPRMRWAFERKDIDRELGLEIHRVLKAGAHAFFFVPAETATTRPHIEAFISLLEGCGFQFNKRFIWDRLRLGMGYNGRCRYEGILFMSKGIRRKPCDLAVPDVLAFKAPYPTKRLHPCEKPQGLMEKLISFATKTGETIMDCFAGSLVAGRAALALGRHALLVEKDERVLARCLGEVTG